MTTTSWAHAVSGDFNTATNWTAGVPAAGDTALITVSGPAYTVTSSQLNSVGTLETAKKATLEVDGSTFRLGSGTGTGALAGTITVVNAGADVGVLQLGATATNTTFKNTGTFELDVDADLVIAGTATLIGNGQLILIDADTIIGTGAFNGTLINGSASSRHTISGTGAVGDGQLTFVNAAKGIIDASGDSNTPDQALDVLTASFTNSGLMEATGTGVLFLKSSIGQSASGRIETRASHTANPGAAIVLDNASIVNGTVSIAKGTSLFSEGGTEEINTSAKPIANAGLIATMGSSTLILSSVKNTRTGELKVNVDGRLETTGTVSGGTALIESGAEILFQGPSSANVTLVAGTFESELVLEDPAQFTGTVAGLATLNTEIDLENIPFADGPTVNFDASKHLLKVTDPITGTIDNIKIVGTGTFAPSLAGDGSTFIRDPPASPASAPNANTNLLAQSMASIGASGNVAGSGAGNLAEHRSSSDFLAPNSHHA